MELAREFARVAGAGTAAMSGGSKGSLGESVPHIALGGTPRVFCEGRGEGRGEGRLAFVSRRLPGASLRSSPRPPLLCGNVPLSLSLTLDYSDTGTRRG